MRVVVRKKFSDKYTGEVYAAGRLLDITPERYEEIRKTDPDLVIAVADELGAAGQSAADDAKTEEGKNEPGAAGQSVADDTETEDGKKEPKKRSKKSDE